MTDAEERDGEALEVRFQWRPDDIRAVRRFVTELMPRRRLIYLRILAAIAVACAAWVAARLIAPSEGYIFAGIVTGVGLLSAVVSHSMYTSLAATVRQLRAEKDYRRVGWSSVTAGRDGVFLRTETRDEFLSWFGVRRIHDKDGFIYFEHAPLMGIAIPSNAFASVEDKATFLRSAQTLYDRREETLASASAPTAFLEDMPPPARLN